MEGAAQQDAGSDTRTASPIDVGEAVRVGAFRDSQRDSSFGRRPEPVKSTQCGTAQEGAGIPGAPGAPAICKTAIPDATNRTWHADQLSLATGHVCRG